MFKRAIGVISITLILGVILPFSAFASSDLLFAPASGSYAVDEPLPVKVIVNSSEKLSAIEATIEFDPKMLGIEVTNISKNISWVVTPTVDHDKGLINFSGIISKDSTLESEIIELSVIGLRPGHPEMRFLSGASTVASDGTGGNTLGKITHASFDILTQDDFGGSIKNSSGEVLGASDTELKITSPDIQDESAWYSLKNVILNWSLPFNVSDVLVGLTRNEGDVGYKSVTDATTTRTINNIEEGEWYFHVTPKGKGINETKHFRIAIDNEAPIIGTTTEKERIDTKDPSIKYNIEATDKISGVSHFEMMLDNSSSLKWIDDGSHEYTVRASGPGEHSLTIAAFDKANNRSESHINFKVDPLDSPVIKLKRNTVPEASPIIAEIIGLPNASVVVTFEGGVVHHEDTLVLDSNGRAAYVLKESIIPGNYQLSALQKLQNGESSLSNIHVELEITPSIIGYIGRNLALSIVLIPILIIGLLYLLWHFGIITWYFRQKMDKRVIQKVAPLALMPQRKENVIRHIETSPLLIKRVIRTDVQNNIVDLRNKR